MDLEPIWFVFSLNVSKLNQNLIQCVTYDLAAMHMISIKELASNKLKIIENLSFLFISQTFLSLHVKFKMFLLEKVEISI